MTAGMSSLMQEQKRMMVSPSVRLQKLDGFRPLEGIGIDKCHDKRTLQGTTELDDLTSLTRLLRTSYLHTLTTFLRSLGGV